MGNTANNNWPYPESTDLVKDGATAIENLADAIDTTLGVYTPLDLGAWTSWTPSWVGVTVGNATQNFKYKQIGKTVFIFGQFIWGSTTTSTSDFTFSLPVTSLTFTNTNINLGDSYYRDDGTNVFYGYVGYQDSTNARLFVANASSTYLQRTGTSSTVPFTWTTSDSFSIRGIYEAA